MTLNGELVTASFLYTTLKPLKETQFKHLPD